MTATTPSPDPTPDTPATAQTTPAVPPASTTLGLEAEPLRTRRPGWRHLDPSPETPADGGSDVDADSPAMSDEPPEQPSTRTGSSRGSSRAERKAIREGIRAGVISVAAGLHRWLARDEYDQAVSLYVADDQDAEEISKPASSLIVRRMGPGVMSPDIADAIDLGIAVAGYVSKQVQRWLYARQLRAAGAATHGPQPEVDLEQTGGVPQGGIPG